MPISPTGQLIDWEGNLQGGSVDLNTGAISSAQNIPAAQTTTPNTNISTPAVPSVSPTQPNLGYTAPDAQEAAELKKYQQTQQQTQTTQPQKPLPNTVSVVDLLNAAGQDSSYAARAQMAQQFGIQSYTGTANQNLELGKKFRELYEAKKTTQAPESGAEARTAMQTGLQPEPTQAVDPTKQFFDIYGGMNPVESQIYTQLSTLLSSVTTQKSLVELYQEEIKSSGVQGLKLELADMNRIMDGTEDDIRAEISNAGGFATESQVQALSSARNKTLLRKASYLSDVIRAKEDYIDNIVNLTKADREQVSKDITNKLGITTAMLDLTSKMQSNARQNYQSIIDKIGWDGLAKTVQGNPEQIKRIEQIFGLAKGELKALAEYKKPLTEKEKLETEKLGLENRKLRQEIDQGPKIETEVIGEKGKEKLINSKTGEVIMDYSGGGAGGAQQLAYSSQKIKDISALLTDGSLDSAVGPQGLARMSMNSFTGAKSNFIAGIEQLREQLTLDKLVQAKQSGATFGALSDGERQTLAAAATKLGTWAVRDNAGNVKGYKASETDFKAELDKINNFAKLDFILKGGNPEAVDVQEMDDGTLWTKNSDGTYTQIK